MKYLEDLICLLYRWTAHYRLTAATYNNLEDIRLFKPTADANTILKLDEIFSESSLDV